MTALALFWAKRPAWLAPALAALAVVGLLIGTILWQRRDAVRTERRIDEATTATAIANANARAVEIEAAQSPRNARNDKDMTNAIETAPAGGATRAAVDELRKQQASGHRDAGAGTHGPVRTGADRTR